ncbi:MULTISPECIES: hypothetical protein [Aquimarina]|uniref:hypothetical protein n=1 Tax=Aquimarina TaxID=290174 RepID=UPI001356D47F|nr:MULTISPECIES: hypothetical protein [Aquimarina]
MVKLTFAQLEEQGKQILSKQSLSKVYGKGGAKRPIFDLPGPSPVYHEDEIE